MGYVRIGLLEFEWDDEKARVNLSKHGVSFAEAATVFLDPLGIILDDLDHSYEEERFMLIGTSDKRNVVVVISVSRRERYRIISARPAVPKERRTYERRNI